MKTTIKKSSILLICIILLAQLCACTGVGLPAHEHTFSDSWKSNESAHWHDATCEHVQYAKDLAIHTFNEDGKCSVCGYESENEEQPTPSHEHTFSAEWTSNAVLHWHEATCEHGEVTKDLSPHTFENGKCTVCGCDDPDYVAPLPPHKDKYYLPSESKKYNGDDLSVTYSYAYTNDLHGFTETKCVYSDENDDEYSKDFTTYAFNEDYSHLAVVQQEFDVAGEIETLTRQRKYEYDFYANSSYKMRYDEFDLDLQEYVFQYIEGRFFNDRGQKTLHYEFTTDCEDGALYYPYYYVYEYDEDGFIQNEIYYSAYYGSEKVDFIEAFAVYTYADDRMSAVSDEYYHYETGYKKDKYTEITVEVKDGVRYETQVIHYADDTVGNTNKFGYAEDGTLVYVNYGGIPEEASVERNDYGQITRYTCNSPIENATMEVTYAENGGNLLSSVKTYDNFLGQHTESSTYSYNANGQIIEAIKVGSGTEDFTVKQTVTYTALKNDELLKHIELFDSILRNFSDNVLVEGLF